MVIANISFPMVPTQFMCKNNDNEKKKIGHFASKENKGIAIFSECHHFVGDHTHMKNHMFIKSNYSRKLGMREAPVLVSLCMKSASCVEN